MKILLAIMLLGLASVGCMSLPAGVSVRVTDDGCNSQGVCPWGGDDPRNWYDAGTREIILAPGQSLKVLAHEGCHAHQHQVILTEAGEPRPNSHGWFELLEWLDTTEGIEYAAAIVGLPPLQAHGNILLEDFAEACGRYMTGKELDATRTAFFEERGFK